MNNKTLKQTFNQNIENNNEQIHLEDRALNEKKK